MSIQFPLLETAEIRGFSIVIPSWCNLDFLRLCITSLKKNSALDNQIIVHLNDGSDGSLAYIQSQKIDHTHSAKNIGVCYSVNQAADLAVHDWIVYLNDDMYCCPGWDIEIAKSIQRVGHDACLLSGTMIEPVATGNCCVSLGNYGRTPADFEEERLLSSFRTLQKPDWSGSTWPPTVISKRWWRAIGGYSTEFSPGIGSDNDLSMKMWHAGCRCFYGVGSSLVYHFISKSTAKIKKNDGRRQFFRKWGIPQSLFDRAYLRRGEIPAQLSLPEPKKNLSYWWSIARHSFKHLP
jgi:GT2 family glycosyltransferase